MAANNPSGARYWMAVRTNAIAWLQLIAAPSYSTVCDRNSRQENAGVRAARYFGVCEYFGLSEADRGAAGLSARDGEG